MGRSYSVCRWERIKTRSLPFKKSFANIYGEGTELHRYIYHIQKLIHRTMILTWIDELELATKIWEEGTFTHNIHNLSIGELLFRVVIDESFGEGWSHPEFSGIVCYRMLDENRAFRLSTLPLSELLKMDKTFFSSVDGYINIRFNSEELLRLSKLVPQECHSELRLPFLLIRSLSGLYAHASFDYEIECQVLGSELENFVFQKLLKLTELPFQSIKEMKPIKKVSNLSMLG